MIQQEAEDVIKNWVRDNRRSRIVAKTSTGPKPNVYLVDVDLKTQGVPETIKGPLGPQALAAPANAADPAQYLFFIDQMPGANWEHPCQYAFVHASKNVTVISSTAPPSAKQNAPLIPVKGVFPEDESS